MKTDKNKEINYRDRDLLFVDLEATGLELERHQIIEIGSLLVDSNSYEIKDKYYAKVKPEHLENADQEALDMGIYIEEEWKSAIDISTALKEFADFAGNSMPAGWKVDFDFNMLEAAYRRHNVHYQFDYHLLDVCSLAYIYFKKKDKPEKLSLGRVCKQLDIDKHEQHGAMVDIEATYKVFKKLIAEYK